MDKEKETMSDEQTVQPQEVENGTENKTVRKRISRGRILIATLIILLAGGASGAIGILYYITKDFQTLKCIGFTSESVNFSVMTIFVGILLPLLILIIIYKVKNRKNKDAQKTFWKEYGLEITPIFIVTYIIAILLVSWIARNSCDKCGTKYHGTEHKCTYCKRHNGWFVEKHSCYYCEKHNAWFDSPHTCYSCIYHREPHIGSELLSMDERISRNRNRNRNRNSVRALSTGQDLWSDWKKESHCKFRCLYADCRSIHSKEKPICDSTGISTREYDDYLHEHMWDCDYCDMW